MKLLKFSLILVLGLLFVSCSNQDDQTDQTINENNILGMWRISNRFPALSTDCEKSEYIVFYADKTFFRDQCGKSEGTWEVVAGEFQINIATVDSVPVSGQDYKCFYEEDNKIKVQSLSNSLFWATYTKVE